MTNVVVEQLYAEAVSQYSPSVLVEQTYVEVVRTFEEVTNVLMESDLVAVAATVAALSTTASIGTASLSTAVIASADLTIPEERWVNSDLSAEAAVTADLDVTELFLSDIAATAVAEGDLSILTTVSLYADHAAEAAVSAPLTVLSPIDAALVATATTQWDVLGEWARTDLSASLSATPGIAGYLYLPPPAFSAASASANVISARLGLASVRMDAVLAATAAVSGAYLGIPVPMAAALVASASTPSELRDPTNPEFVASLVAGFGLEPTLSTVLVPQGAGRNACEPICWGGHRPVTYTTNVRMPRAKFVDPDPCCVIPDTTPPIATVSIGTISASSSLSADLTVSPS